MQDNDERFLQTGVDLAQLLFSYGLRAGDTLLDVGCGYGRLPIGLLSGTDFHGRYYGFDVLATQVEWCASSITPIAPNFQFRHLDVRNARYNPNGKLDPAKIRFPLATARMRYCALFSIFTHFYQADIKRYLREIRRTLRPGGLCLSTWFLFDEARLAAVQSPKAGYPMIHRLDDVTLFAEIEDPLRAIAYEESFVRSMATEAGLEVVKIERGTWAGEQGTIFQDIVLLRRPGRPQDHIRSELGQLKRWTFAEVKRRRRR